MDYVKSCEFRTYIFVLSHQIILQALAQFRRKFLKRDFGEDDSGPAHAVDHVVFDEIVVVAAETGRADVQRVRRIDPTKQTFEMFCFLVTKYYEILTPNNPE